MKPRARRVTLAAAALGVSVLAVLVVLNWGTVRDHVEAWRFQRTRNTEAITPNAERAASCDSMPMSLTNATPLSLFYLLADCSGSPVTFCPADCQDAPDCWIWITDEEEEPLRPATMVKVLKRNGWRVIEQRFPQASYVVVYKEDFFAYGGGE